MRYLFLLFSVAFVIFGCSTNNNGTVTVVPLAPTNLTGTVISTNQINLSWTDNATNEDGYKIERKTGAGNYSVVGSTGSNMTTFTDLGLTPSTSYTYRVYAYNSAGNSIQYSNEVTLTTQDSIPSWLTNGLVGYWPFNGNANDESGNGNNGTVNGATLAADRFGNSGKSYSFDGINDWININNSNSLNPPSKITISAWVNTMAYNSSNASMIINKGWDQGPGHYDLLVFSPNNKSRFVIGSNLFVESNSIINLNQWVFITATIDNFNMKIYVNGILENTVLQTNNNSFGTNSDPLYIGKHDYNNAPYYFNGKLDDIRIYNRALSASEVAYLAAH